MAEHELKTAKTEEKRKKRGLLLLLLVLCLGAVLGGVLTRVLDEPTAGAPVLPPDTLPPSEARALPDEETDEEAAPQSEEGGSVNLTFSDQVTISLAEKRAKLLFYTPARSDKSMVLELLIRDALILRSGALAPGSRLESLPLLDNAVLQPGGYDGLFRVSFYDPDTGERAGVDAEIPVKVTVTEDGG